MIDVWLIFTLLIPFMEVILHTKMEMIRQRLNSIEMGASSAAVEDRLMIKTVWNNKNDALQEASIARKKDGDTQTLRFEFKSYCLFGHFYGHYFSSGYFIELLPMDCLWSLFSSSASSS